MLRVRGLVDPDRIGLTSWIVRVQCTPNAAAAVAEALGRRPETAWISLTSGGTEITSWCGPGPGRMTGTCCSTPCRAARA